jgi:D-glycero-alpha-D-manno-heptose 1-phosphate guanylyltransferase
MQAIILAGGFGTRLRTAIADVPKPMAPIGDKPFLAYLLDYLKEQGITQVVLSVHYLREQIQAYFQSEYRGMAVRYAVEEEPLGTGGAILHSMKMLDKTAPVFVLNGDTFLKLDYQGLYQQHSVNSPLITMALRKVVDCSRYGIVQVEKNIVMEFKDQGDDKPGLINAGVYLINPALFDVMSLPAQFSFERDFLFPNVNKIHPEAFAVDDYFIDIGIPEDYSRAVKELPDLLSLASIC